MHDRRSATDDCSTTNSIARVERSKHDATAWYDRLSQWYNVFIARLDRQPRVRGIELLNVQTDEQVLEVNATAGFKGFFEATGVSPAPYIAKLAIKRADGHVDGDQIADLVTTLDDSVPECKPTIGSKPDTPETVGYTERVAVSGGQKIEYAVAKSDTGARRTSIDTDIAAAIRAGPVVDTTRVKSGTRNSHQKRPLVELDLKRGDQWHTITASIEDRSHMNYSVLLGRDVLRGYRVDIKQRVDEE